MDDDDDNGVPPECERTPFWVSLGPGSGFRVATRDDLREAGWVTRGEMDESIYWLLDKISDEAREELRKAGLAKALPVAAPVEQLPTLKRPPEAAKEATDG